MASQVSQIQRSSLHDHAPAKDETTSKEFACCLIALNTISSLSQAELAEIDSFDAIKQKAIKLNVKIDNLVIENSALLFPGIDVNHIKSIFCRPEMAYSLSDDLPLPLLTDASKALIKKTLSAKVISMSMLNSAGQYLSNYVKKVAEDPKLREILDRPIADSNKSSMMQFYTYLFVAKGTIKIGFLVNLFLKHIDDQYSCQDIAQGLNAIGFTFDIDAYRRDPSYRDNVIAEIVREIL